MYLTPEKSKMLHFGFLSSIFRTKKPFVTKFSLTFGRKNYFKHFNCNKNSVEN